MKITANTVLMTTTLLSATLLSGCAGYYPQTREEAIAHPGTKHWSFSVPRKLDDVVASVNKQAEACVNETHSQGIGTRSIQRSVQIMTIKKVSASRAELDYRQLSNTGIGQPEGGIFMFNANFESGPQLDRGDVL